MIQLISRNDANRQAFVDGRHSSFVIRKVKDRPYRNGVKKTGSIKKRRIATSEV